MHQVFTPRKKRLASFLLILPALVGLLIILAPKPAAAANPTTINFQGKMVNADGTNVANSTYTIIFRLYNTASPTTSTACASDSSCWWEETNTSVTTTNGVFQVELGSVCALTSACNSGHSGIDFNTNNALYLTMKFNGDAAGFMSPTIHMTTVPYAFNADKLGGIAASGFIQNGTGTQTSSNFHISNTGVADVQLQSPLFDTATSNGTLGIGTTNAGVLTIGNVTNTTVLFNLKNSSATALQVKNGSGNELLTVDTSGSSVILGKKGSSGINGSLVFNTTNASNTTITLVAASTGTSYSLTLPTTGPSTSQCLKTDVSTASQLTFASCGGGGGGTLAADYTSGSSSADQTILLSSGDGGGILIQDAASTVGTLFAVQKASAAASYFSVTNSTITMQDSSAANAVTIDLTGHALKVFSSDGTTNYGSITADNASATFKSNTGTTTVGNGTGAITVNAGSSAAVNITGHANSTWQTDAGSLTIQAGTTLSLLSSTSSAISLDSGSTGNVSIGTGANGKAVSIGNGQSGTTVDIDAGTSSTGIEIGNTSTAHGIKIGTNATGDNDVSIGGTNASSTLTLEGGTASSAIQIGNGSTAHGIQIGANAAGVQTISIGNAVASSALTLTAGSGNMALNTTSGTITLQSTTSGQINLIPGGTSNISIGTSDTTGTLLVLDTDTDSTEQTAIAGAIYYNSALRSFRCGINDSPNWVSCIGGLLSSNTSPSSAIANTATETAFSLSYAMPANYCTAGRVIRWTATGVFSTATTNITLTLRMRTSTPTTLAVSGAINVPTAQTSRGWRLEGQTICNAAPSGSTATESQGMVNLGLTNITLGGGEMVSTGTTNLATNGALTLQVTAKWSAAATGTTITMRQFIIEGLGP